MPREHNLNMMTHTRPGGQERSCPPLDSECTSRATDLVTRITSHIIRTNDGPSTTTIGSSGWERFDVSHREKQACSKSMATRYGELDERHDHLMK